MRGAFAAIAAVAASACSAMPEPTLAPHAPKSLADAESSFAAQSVREGMRAAFLAWLAPGATLFRGGPVNGPAFIAANPDPPVELDWRPVHVEVAASGEMGLSTGPWTARSRGDPALPPGHGQFVSIWKRDAGGPWRVLVDLGISHPGPALAAAPLRAGVTPATGAGASVSLAAAEAQFAKLAAEAGDAAAYTEFVSASVRVYREGDAPFLGRAAALGALAAGEGQTEWMPETTDASASGDLGYVIGRYGPRGCATAGHYVRVWRRETDGWRIALDIVNALPQRPSGGDRPATQ